MVIEKEEGAGFVSDASTVIRAGRTAGYSARSNRRI